MDLVRNLFFLWVLGTYTWTDNRSFKGDWKDNRMHGRGKFLWGNGRKYVGEYTEDKKHGFGVFSW